MRIAWVAWGKSRPATVVTCKRVSSRRLSQREALDPGGRVEVDTLAPQAAAAKIVHLCQARVQEPGQERELGAKGAQQLGALGAQLLQHQARASALVLDQEDVCH